MTRLKCNHWRLVRCRAGPTRAGQCQCHWVTRNLPLPPRGAWRYSQAAAWLGTVVQVPRLTARAWRPIGTCQCSACRDSEATLSQARWVRPSSESVPAQQLKPDSGLRASDSDWPSARASVSPVDVTHTRTARRSVQMGSRWDHHHGRLSLPVHQ